MTTCSETSVRVTVANSTVIGVRMPPGDHGPPLTAAAPAGEPALAGGSPR